MSDMYSVYWNLNHQDMCSDHTHQRMSYLLEKLKNQL